MHRPHLISLLVISLVTGEDRIVGGVCRRRCWGLVALVVGLLLLGCSDDEAPLPVVAPDAGPPDAGDGGLPDAGPDPAPCPPGELELTDGSCLPAGIPAGACGEGFVPTGDGACDAVLPPSPCGDGEMAIPGETECRPVAPCGSGTWGDIPTDGTTQHVDGAYAGQDSDGSAAQPWTTIEEAVDAAAPGAIVAIAAGSYHETVWIMDEPVRLWGTCPSAVEVTGAIGMVPTIYVRQADGTEIRGLAITGIGSGPVIRGAVDVVVDQVWIHDTAGPGFEVFEMDGPGRASLTRSLVERARSHGVAAWRGAELDIEESAVRHTQPESDVWGWGLLALSEEAANAARLSARRSVIEGNHEAGVQGWSSVISIEDTVIRDTQPSAADQSEGHGILTGPYEGSEDVGSLELRRSVVESNHLCGVCAVNAEATVEHTVVRDSLPQESDGRQGFGMVLAGATSNVEDRPTVTVRESVVERSHSLGLGVAGVDATIEAVLVRHTAAELDAGVFGRGLVVELNPESGVRGRLALSGSVVEASHEVGLVVLGSEATIDSVLVVDTRPRPVDQLYGRGLIVQLSVETLARSEVSVLHSAFEQSHESGLYLAGADVVMSDTVVRETLAQGESELFGDGLIGSALHTAQGSESTSLRIERCAISHSARAAVASFGATVELGASLLDCNTFDLNGELFANQPFVLSDLGGNLCACGAEVHACQLASGGLAPPEPLSD